MKNKPMMMAITIMAVVGMALPLASAGFTNYVFKEDFNGTTLDNSTWVNTSNPFPYEMKDGNLVIKTYQEPQLKYARSKEYDISGMDYLHVESKITFDMDRLQNSSSYSIFKIFFFLGKDSGYFGSQGNSTDVRFQMYWGEQFDVSINYGASNVWKSYSGTMAQKLYGNETTFYIVGDYYRNIDKNNRTDYWTAQITLENETRVPILANLDRISSNIEDKFMVTLGDYHYTSSPPANGEIKIDYIYAGAYEPNGKGQKHDLFPVILTFSMVFMAVGSIGTLADTIGKYEDLWYYMMIFGIALLGTAFIFLTQPILGIPAYLYSIPPFLLVVEELYSVRQHGLF